MTADRLLLSMGMVPSGRPGDPLRPRLRALDPTTGRVDDVVSYDPPAALHPDDPEHAEFTGAWVGSGELLQCTRTEVLVFAWPDLTLRARVSHPLLHDVHHAIRLPDGRLAVASTGIDAVLLLDDAGTLHAHHWLDAPGTDTPDAAAFTARFGPARDLRRVRFETFKPHHHHPNYLAWDGDALWATCLSTGVAVCVTDPGRPPRRFPEGGPHDGVLAGALRFYTTITGLVVAIDPATGDRVRVWDVSQVEGRAGLPGWCRAIAVTDTHLIVGMTTLRKSRHREWLRRVLRGRHGRSLPSRVLAIDRHTGALDAVWPVGNEAGGTIYGITPWPGNSPGTRAPDPGANAVSNLPRT